MDPTRREAKRAQRQEELVDVAFELVRRDGLATLTVSALAEATGSAVGSMYHYFPGKDALLVAMQQRALSRFRERLEVRLAAVRNRRSLGTAALDALRDALIPIATYLGDAGSQEHELMDAFLSAPEPVLDITKASELEQHVRPILLRCAELIDEAVAQGALCAGNAAQRANLLWIAAYGLDHFRKRDRLVPRPLRSSAMARVMLGTLLEGWGATANHSSRALAAAFARAHRFEATAL